MINREPDLNRRVRHVSPGINDQLRPGGREQFGLVKSGTGTFQAEGSVYKALEVGRSWSFHRTKNRSKVGGLQWLRRSLILAESIQGQCKALQAPSITSCATKSLRILFRHGWSQSTNVMRTLFFEFYMSLLDFIFRCRSCCRKRTTGSPRHTTSLQLTILEKNGLGSSTRKNMKQPSLAHVHIPELTT